MTVLSSRRHNKGGLFFFVSGGIKTQKNPVKNVALLDTGLFLLAYDTPMAPSDTGLTCGSLVAVHHQLNFPRH